MTTEFGGTIDDVDGYDIIGDVHGCAEQLELLLKKLGFVKRSGAYKHTERKAIFVGDLIDRGKHQVEALDLVKAMVDADSAQIVMGNHEFNAISYATQNPEIPGEFMRPHSDKNRSQHKKFIDQVQIHTGLYAQEIEWFKTMPLYLELDGFRVVHACWDNDAIRMLQQWVTPGTPMSEDFVIKANQKGTDQYNAIEVVLKGPELHLKKRYGQEPFKDKDGHTRDKARIRWWNADATTLRDLADIPDGAKTESGDDYPVLPNTECSAETKYAYRADKPVFFGHYWRKWEPDNPLDWTTKAACLDFSVIEDGGRLVAYRWTGESQVSLDNFVHHM